MILRTKSDLRPVLFVIGFLSFQFAAYLLYPSLLLFPILALGCAILGSINHNQMHSPAFSSSQGNFLWNFVLSWGMGASASQITVTHILGHHRHFRSSKDWTSYELAKGQGLGRLTSYLKNSVLEIAKHRREFLKSPQQARWRKRIGLERAFLWVLALALLIWAPLPFLICYLAPWIAGLLLVLVVNLLQHDGLDLQSDHHSRDFLAPLGNWITFNAFYHTVHHEKPSLHWSLLPAEHHQRGLKGEDSFWTYLYTHYIAVSLKRKQTESDAWKL